MQSKNQSTQFIRKNDKTSKSMENLFYPNKFQDFDFLSSSLEKFHNANNSSFFGERRLSLSESSLDFCYSYVYDSDSFKQSGSSSKSSEDEFVLKELEFNSVFLATKPREKCSFEDSGIEDNTDHFSVLERKIDKLYEIVEAQGRTLSALATETHAATDAVVDIMQNYLSQAYSTIQDNLYEQCMSEVPDFSEESKRAGAAASSSVKSGAKALLDALETQRQTAIIDESIKSTLNNFLQSDELREAIVTATTASLKSVVEQQVQQFEMSSYRPLLRRSQRYLTAQLINTLEDAFRSTYHYNVGQYTLASYKSSRIMRASLERHQRLLESTMARVRDHRVVPAVKNTLSRILRNELIQWREVFTSSIKNEVAIPNVSDTPLNLVPSSPSQPTEPGKSVIEQLMSAAEINNRMRDGDVNGSFARALSAADLSLVMAACRAADPDDIFEPPCRLQQHVLLSLLQQLATDMVHETQLKCRYLDDALMNLDANNPATARHLPPVLTEACNNLSTFLRKYPSHVCGRQIQMFILAAESLLIETQEKLAEQSVASFNKSKMKIRPIYES